MCMERNNFSIYLFVFVFLRTLSTETLITISDLLLDLGRIKPGVSESHTLEVMIFPEREILST